MENPLGMNDDELKVFFQNVRFASYMQYAVEHLEDNVASSLGDLILHHYPMLGTEERPKILDAIEDVTENIGFRVMLALYNLVETHKEGLNIRNKYPELDNWIEFFRNEKTLELQDPNKNPYPYMPDEFWRKSVAEDNQGAIELFYWQNLRIAEFINEVQKWTLGIFDSIYDFNHDEWTVYNMIFRNEYESFMEQCDEIELFIDSGFPVEDFDCFMEKFEELSLDERLKIEDIGLKRLDKKMKEMENLKPYGSLSFKSYKEYLETLTLW